MPSVKLWQANLVRHRALVFIYETIYATARTMIDSNDGGYFCSSAVQMRY